jgi:hypothetical protein
LWPFAPTEAAEVSHFVIIGFGAMGQMLAVQLAQLAHFPNRKRSRFTIADQNIESVGRQFLSRFNRFSAWDDRTIGVPYFDEPHDEWYGPQFNLPTGLATGCPQVLEYVCNAQFIEAPSDIGDERFAYELIGRLTWPGTKPAIMICGQRDHDNFDAAVRLQARLACLGVSFPIFVWLPRQPALARALAQDGRFVPFGVSQMAAGLGEIESPRREHFARIFHDYHAKRAKERDANFRIQPWASLSEEFRESNRQAADHLVIKVATLGYRLRHQGEVEPKNRVELTTISTDKALMLAEMEHNRWSSERLLNGWRYAPTIDRSRKLHENLVPSAHLGSALSIDLDQILAALRSSRQGPYVLEGIPLH